eukprot:1616744-Prymnesium_polylepis.1
MADDEPLFEHLLLARFPVLALATHFYVAPGPEAAREAAEYLVYHLCVRPPLSQELMVREAAAQRCKQSTGRHLLFGPNYLQNVVQAQEDLCNAGIVPLSLAMRRILDIFVSNRLPARDLGLLPPTSRRAPSCGSGDAERSRTRIVWPARPRADEVEPLVGA